jgi:hypothetical protein
MSKRAAAICACIFLGGFLCGWATENSKDAFSHNGQHWQELTDL